MLEEDKYVGKFDKLIEDGFRERMLAWVFCISLN